MIKKKRGRPSKKKEVIRHVEETKREEVLEAPKQEIVGVELCKTPGCLEPLAPDQPNHCLTHTRRN